ncbi:hypothetical protein [Kitasatospora sp. NPDC088346]|uniref:CAP domain-containing protein n=1 Tax=Kitasatospora sp. NPDC088346 TaxID=3364073 RepID=UPI00380274DF
MTPSSAPSDGSKGKDLRPSTAAPSPALSPTPSRTTRPPAPIPAGLTADESKLLDLLNERRKAMGLAEVHPRSNEIQQADACTQKNLANHTLTHCGYEVLYKGGKGTTPEQLIDAWFNSPKHKEALTHATSRNAGPSIATDSAGTLIAAINIDY